MCFILLGRAANPNLTVVRRWVSATSSASTWRDFGSVMAFFDLLHLGSSTLCWFLLFRPATATATQTESARGSAPIRLGFRMLQSFSASPELPSCGHSSAASPVVGAMAILGAMSLIVADPSSIQNLQNPNGGDVSWELLLPSPGPETLDFDKPTSVAMSTRLLKTGFPEPVQAR